MKLTVIHTNTTSLRLALGSGGGILGEANLLRYIARYCTLQHNAHDCGFGWIVVVALVMLVAVVVKVKMVEGVIVRSARSSCSNDVQPEVRQTPF